jgi:hypothetical protein
MFCNGKNALIFQVPANLYCWFITLTVGNTYACWYHHCSCISFITVLLKNGVDSKFPSPTPPVKRCLMVTEQLIQIVNIVTKEREREREQ